MNAPQSQTHFDESITEAAGLKAVRQQMIKILTAKSDDEDPKESLEWAVALVDVLQKELTITGVSSSHDTSN